VAYNKFFYIFILLSVGLFFNKLRADQTWSGGATPNVLNENLLISGTCTMGANASISALASDVTVTVQVNGAEQPIVRGPGKVLEFITNANREIIFNITDSADLSFEGGASFLQIIQRGTGTVRWKINGGRTITFRNSSSTGGNGVRYFISMENATQAVIIKRNDATKYHAAFKILNDSMMTFIAPTLLANSPTERGAIVVDTANTNSCGRTYLELGDEAGFIIAGHYVTNLTDPNNVNVDLAQPAGKEPILIIEEGNANQYTNWLVINGNTVVPQLYVDPTRTSGYTGEQSGFILGTNSTFKLKNNTYLDFVGTTTNIDPLESTSTVLDGRKKETVLKDRNASALIVDGAPSGTTGALDARVLMEGNSGMFFRSAADLNGSFTKQVDSGFSFTINPALQPAEAGNIVFDIEGAFYVLGASSGTNIINVVSREVAPTGGYVEIGVGSAKFPKITFANYAQNTSYLAQYAKSCVFVNNRVNFSNMIIRHDDFFHEVNATNSPQNSDPTYIGGDTFKLVTTETLERPKIALYNSSFNLHTSAALTGLDLLVTNTSLNSANTSYLRYYQNGRKIDKGTGRALILGTNPGSYAYDYATVVDNASYLDILQQVNQTAGYTHQLNLVTATNDSTVISDITGDISTQYSIHTLYLGNESNIQVGSQSAPAGVTLTTYPHLYINGNFFSFMSQGGNIGQPELAASIGQGGMFVDINGTVSISTSARASFGMMVTKGSSTATITLPRSRVNFSEKVGIAFWDLDLSSEQTIISSGQKLSDFTIDWVSTNKDYDGGFIPFDPVGQLGQTVVAANLYHLPTVKGEVNELQIKRSRIGDPVHVMVDGGLIRDLLFLKGYDSSEAQTGVVALKNDGRVGIGNNETRRDTINAAIVLGINGVTLVPDGNGIVDLNTDIEINNYCHIIAGPNFGQSTAQELYINADEPRELRVKRDGVLDLSTFTSDNMRVVFSGNVSLVFEPGSKLLLGGGTIFFTNKAKLRLQNEIESVPTTGTSVASTDDFRVQFIGTGKIIFDEDAAFSIEKDSYLGIEWDNLVAAITSTSLTLSIRDNASLQMGTESLLGGAFQIGNTASKSGTVSLTLELNGPDALFEINSQGFFGIGVGIVDKHQAAPNSWRVGSLYNVHNFTLNITQGIMKHNTILPGTSEEAALFAIGPATYALTIASYADFSALGGGNMIRLGSGVTWVNPTVLTTASDNIGIFSSTSLIRDRNNQTNLNALALSGSSQNFFNVFKTKEARSMASPAANFARVTIGNNQICFIHSNRIYRKRWIRILGGYGARVPPDYSLRIGAVAINIDQRTARVNNVVQIIR